MLRQLEIRGFKAFGVEPTVIPLSAFTLIAGINGAGKTSILQALELFGMLSRGTLGEALQQRRWEYGDLVHLKSGNSRIELDATVETAGKTLRWELILGKRRYQNIAAERVIDADGRELMGRKERTMWRVDERSGEKVDEINQSLQSSWLGTLESSDADRFPSLVELSQWGKGVRPYVVLDPLVLRESGSAHLDELGAHGEGLAALIRGMDAETRLRMVGRVQEHYPSLIDVKATRTLGGATRLEVDEMWGGRKPLRFSARQVSDGLLRLLALASLHELETPPSMLLIDEIENGVHPHLLRAIVLMLRDLAAKGVQVVATTHSPVAMSYVGSAEEVVLVGRDGDGEVRVSRLADSKRWATLQEAFAPGEAWYAVGEEALLSDS